MHLRTRLAGWLLAMLLVRGAPRTSLAAQGVNLSWSRCFGEGVGTQNRNFACNTNTGSNVMTGSFVLSSEMSQVIGTEIVLQLAAAGDLLPSWWDFFNVASCRPTSLSANFVANPADAVCVDWSQGQATGGLGAYCDIYANCAGGPTSRNAAIVKIVDATTPANGQDLEGGVEYFDFNIVINNTRTLSFSGCGGCTIPVCIAQLDRRRAEGQREPPVHLHAHGAGEQLHHLAGRWIAQLAAGPRLPGCDTDASIHLGEREIALPVSGQRVA